MGTIDDMKSILTQSDLDALCEKFHIPRTIYPKLPGRNQRIRNSLTSKIGVYTRFFNLANYWIPFSQFPVDILEYFQINLSQLSVIAAAKVSHFEILCRVHGFVLTFPEPFLCFVGINRYYELDEIVYPVFLTDDDEGGDGFVCFYQSCRSTKVRIGEKQIKEGQTLLLDSTRGRVVPLAGVNDQGNQNDDIQDDGAHVVQDEGVNIVADEDVKATVADKPKGTRKKMKTASGASGSVLPPKRLREDYGTFGDAGASNTRKSLVVLQDLLDSSTLAAEVGSTAAITIPFVTSSVTPTPERESDGCTDSISGPNLQTQHPADRFVISSDSSHHSSANAVDDEVTSIARSSAPPPPVLTAAVATTIIIGATSAPVYESGIKPVQRSIFRDSTSPNIAEAAVVGPSQPIGVEVSTDTFYISQEMDSETLQQTYVPK
ncbi:hypothetical protein Tco_1076155 [Tanacetum coccineum]